MILVQGCSFTYGTGLEEHTKKFRYSSFIERALNEKVRNISGPSKDNFTMYFELHAYLLHAMQSKVEIPRVIIWQLSDSFRRSMIDHACSGMWQPNNIDSLISSGEEYGRRHIKMFYWQSFTRITKIYENLVNKREFDKAARYKKKMGMGTTLELSTGQPNNGKRSHRFHIGDETFIYHELLIGMHINTIQEMCKQLGIKLMIINYYGTPKNILEDPIYKNIDRSNYLIENSERWGMYNHLCWKGFDRSVDNFHFNVDAHYYQAEVVLKFLKSGGRLKVEEVVHDEMGHMPVFDYTSTRELSAAGRRYLLHRAK